MASRNGSTTDHLKPYSRAKADLIRSYVTKYLSILEVARGQRPVYVLDLMCGEGIYGDGSKGSAVQIAEAVREYHFARDSQNPLKVVLNDNGRSSVEPDRMKIDRVEEAIAGIVEALAKAAPHIEFDLSRMKASERASRHRAEIRGKRRAKSLYILDPAGYTQFEIQKVRTLLEDEGTEVFLFLPLPEMYRFAKNQDETHPLGKIMLWLWGGEPLEFDSPATFAKEIFARIRERFGRDVYTTPVFLYKSKHDAYLLVHFTRHELGLERMVDALWEMDPVNGHGFGPDMNQGSIFGQNQFADDLLSFIQSSPRGRSNEEVAIYATLQQMRPKHAADVLRGPKKQGLIEVVDMATQEPKRAFYLPYRSRQKATVVIRSVKNRG